MISEEDRMKRAAAVAAVAEVESGMKLDLSTGSTAAFALDEIARRIREEGLRVVGIPSSLAPRRSRVQSAFRLPPSPRPKRSISPSIGPTRWCRDRLR